MVIGHHVNFPDYILTRILRSESNINQLYITYTCQMAIANLKEFSVEKQTVRAACFISLSQYKYETFLS